MTKPHVVILGAGPAGLGAAFHLARRQVANVTLLEAQNVVGGMAGSFEVAGMRVDYGSHRLHPACDPAVLADIRSFLGDDLLDRPRHGRIRLRGRWIHFPLKPLDLLMRLPPGFALGVAGDVAGKRLRGRQSAGGAATYASVLEAGLGKTICRDFYFPYARKLWGVEPDQLSAVQAQRRVSANSVAKMARKVLAAIPGLKPKGSGRFFYPRRGYGQISEAYQRAAADAGVTIQLGAPVQTVEAAGLAGYAVSYTRDGQAVTAEADYVWSTIPLTRLATLLKPAAPQEYLDAAAHIAYRAMILIYLVLEQDRFTPYDAHYFPGADIPISRLSEPKNYSASSEPQGVTVLCAELPCAVGDAVWGKSDQELGQIVQAALERAGIPVRAPVSQVITRRLPSCYPIYAQGYEAHFTPLDAWLGQIDRLLTFGRQGLFAHDNTHHALYMGYCAAECLDETGRFDQTRWQEYRRIFATNVVED